MKTTINDLFGIPSKIGDTIVFADWSATEYRTDKIYQIVEYPNKKKFIRLEKYTFTINENRFINIEAIIDRYPENFI